MTRDELVARLAQLDSADRGWLLAELPPALRRELAQWLADDATAVATESPAVSPAAATGWQALDAGRTADVLATEPVWLVSALLRAAPAPWREQVLAAMPARRRHEVEMADRANRPLGARAARLLLDLCQARVTAAGPAAEVRGGFAALVDQLRSRFA